MLTVAVLMTGISLCCVVALLVRQKTIDPSKRQGWLTRTFGQTGTEKLGLTSWLPAAIFGAGAMAAWASVQKQADVTPDAVVASPAALASESAPAASVPPPTQTLILSAPVESGSVDPDAFVGATPNQTIYIQECLRSL